MSDIKVNNIKNVNGTHGPVISGTSVMSSTGAMSLPRGNTAYRGGRGRGIFGGGYDAASPYPGINVLDYVEIATTGNAHDFGDLSVSRTAKSGGGSATRGIFISGRFSPTADYYNVIDYVTISSTGNSQDFGDLINHINPSPAGCSNQVRGVYGGGYYDYVSAGNTPNLWLGTMGYYSIASKGDSVYFGELINKGRRSHTGSNTTRGIWGATRGGVPGATNVWINTIEYVTIATTGDAQEFGDATEARSNTTNSMTSPTRMVMQGGLTPGYSNVIDYITTASKGDALDFGDTGAGQQAGGAVSNSTRGVFCPGTNSNGNVIEYITIATLGNAADFGDLSFGRRVYGTVCDSHGGLG